MQESKGIRIAGLFLLVILFCVAGSAVAAKPQAEEAVDLQLRWRHQFQFAGYYAAVEKGYYREEGLDVRLHAGDPAHQPVQEVLSGRSQYAEGNSEILYKRLQGKPLVALAAIFQHSPSVLLVRKDSGIETVHDLIGKKIMLMNIDEDADFLTMFLNEGIPLSKLDIIASSYNLDDLVKGKVDAFNAYLSNEPYYLKQLNIAYTIFDPSNYRVDFYSDILFTSESELQNHPKRVEAMRRATLKGWHYAMDHPEEIITLLIGKYAVEKSREHLEYEAAEMRKLIYPEMIEIGHMNQGRWQHMADIFVQSGLVELTRFLDGFIYDATPKRLPEWIKPAFMAAAGIILLILAVAYYLFRLNRRLFSAEAHLLEANEHLSAEINERKNIEETLRQNEKHYRSLVENMLGGIAYCQMLYENDRPNDFIFLEVNPAFEQIMGMRQLAGKKISEILPGIRESNPEWFEVLGRIDLSGHPEKFETYLPALAVWLSVAIYRTGEQNFFTICDNITERKELQHQYEHLAQTDYLTGLANRRYFMQQAEAELLRVFRYGGTLSLLMLDLDHFKKINDSYGHMAGDVVLQKFSSVCQAILRDVDVIGRLGGEEFAILLPETGEKEAVEVAERLRMQIANTRVPLEKGLAIEFTVSIGVSFLNELNNNLEALLDKADKALYKAKAAGRDRVCIQAS